MHSPDSKYPSIRCGLGAISQPLAPNNENAFNPCFISLLFLCMSMCFAVFGVLKLVRVCRIKSRNGFSLHPKNTGLAHYVRSNSVMFHALLYFILACFTNIHNRYSDFKIVAFLVTSLVIACVIAPLHLLETVTSPIQFDILLLFWPCLILLQLVLVYQDFATSWPLVLSDHATLLESIIVVNSCSIFTMQISKSWWRPGSDLKLSYMNDSNKILELNKPNIVQRATFSWLSNLIVSSYYNQTLTEKDLPPTLSEVSTHTYASALESHWLQQHSNHSPKTDLIIALLRAFGRLGLITYSLDFVSQLLGYVEPQLLRLLIKFFSDKQINPQIPLIRGWLIAISMFANTCFETYIDSKTNLLLFEVGLSVKASLLSLIYQKSLRLSPEAKLTHSSGAIMNLISVDVSRAQSAAQSLGSFFTSPVELIVCMLSLWSLLGKSAFVALAVLLLSMPLNAVVIKVVKRLSKTQMQYKDKRTRMISEIITAIKSLKLYAWENPLVSRLLHVRNNEELRNWKKIKIAFQLANMVWYTLSIMVSVSTLASFTIWGNIPLTPDLVFPALSLLSMLTNPLLELPVIFNTLVEASVSLDRIATFLLAPEINSDFIQSGPARTHEGETTINISQASFIWSESKAQKTLMPDENDVANSDKVDSNYAIRDLNFTAKKGDLVTIVGRVGSGKSSLLSAILGQLPVVNNGLTAPKFEINGSIAYAAQQPWISNASVKENILFGHRYEESFYHRTIDACQLLPDLKQLPDGDDTQVGEKGISLSGGQKARISLARAVYARADIYLLDDVLSAVDNHVARKLTEQVIGKRGLLASKTVILSTNSLAVLNYSDSIQLIKDGKIVEQGSLDDAYNQSKNPQLYELLSEFGRRNDSSSDKDASVSGKSSTDDLKTSPQPTNGESEKVAENSIDDKSYDEGAIDENFSIDDDDNHFVSLDRIGTSNTLRRASIATFKCDPFKEAIPTLKTGPLAEVSAKGKVKWSVYYQYAKACSIPAVIVFLVTTISVSLAGIARTYFLKTWAEENLKNGENKNAVKFSLIFFGLGMLISTLSFTKSVVMFTVVGIQGSKNIHEKMVRRIIKAPMRFFERTPVGRIMNRFTNDISKIDETLPRVFSIFFQYLVKTAVNLIVVGSSLPLFILIMLALSAIYMYYQRFYVSISRELKRMLSVSRSPIFAHLQESLNGVDSIRAYDQIDRFEYISNANIDFNLKSLYMIRVVNRWLAVRLRLIGSLIVLSASCLAIFTLKTKHPLSAGMTGFIMSYALSITGTLNSLVRNSADVESNVVAVERCLEYFDLPLEEDEESLKLTKPPVSWPQSGSVKFKDYSTRYDTNLDLVLKNINLDIKSGEKIGVVGRTGAGKSSLTLALFRMIEPVTGCIEVDGLNTSNLFLYDLRHNLSIIPQDSQLFEGSLRQNVNPLGYFTDDEIWRALELSHLKDFILQLDRDQNITDKLECQVAEGGSNFSAGQRQLICLARALLNTSNVLVLDEATAAVDAQTDKIIQQTIRQEFKRKTIIAIAHRLDTVMDSDRIVSLDNGEVKEFDTPENLLSDPNSIFYSLCKQGGFI